MWCSSYGKLEVHVALNTMSMPESVAELKLCQIHGWLIQVVAQNKKPSPNHVIVWTRLKSIWIGFNLTY